MGFLRILLALIVLASHSGLISWIYGVFAVECFFAVSGFYMQMILSEDYANQRHWRRKFYLSRLLRIFIPYWLILACIVATQLIQHTSAIPTLINGGNFLEMVKMSAMNLFIVGIDQVKLARVLSDCVSPGFDRMVMGQAWSIALELGFYAAAPFILRSFGPLLFVTMASAVAKAVLLYTVMPGMFHFGCWDGLIVGIFPLELCVFGAGAVAYRFYARYIAHRFRERNGPAYLAGIAVALGLSVWMYFGLANRDTAMVRNWYLVLTAFILLLPFLFATSRHMRLDRFAGDLSYPVYLWHIFAISQVHRYFQAGESITTLAVAIGTLLLALPVTLWIDRPLTVLRHRTLRHAAHLAPLRSNGNFRAEHVMPPRRASLH